MTLNSVAEAARKVGPAVVRIEIELNLPANHDAFSKEGQPGVGSGFIFSKDGLVLTNAHVIEYAREIKVNLMDGREYKAVVKGKDSFVDVAVLQIVSSDKSDEFPVAKLSDSDGLTIGQSVIAIGSPNGLDNSVTKGIIANAGRSWADIKSFVRKAYRTADYIQTDVALYTGNSGGPLVDVETGDVIGINANTLSTMPGTTFSIQINRIRDIIDALSQGREVQHAYLGVSVVKCTPPWAAQMNVKAAGAYTLPESHGALVWFVHPSTPAAEAGLRGGDVILKVGGKAVESPGDVRRFTDRAAVGETLTLFVYRDSQEIEISVQPMDLVTRLREARDEENRMLEAIERLKDDMQF
ncbi:serine protease Do [Fistulifera solaris]|uniref:Serine protease Do n=1 Tax=Fistulifera solaris TaxID=1519565 RepID=A0A1Z5JQC2_FISSO|nr:serine protease Do [Fistulifera solaris]|eukprot:GAX16230.1 serine protease Do [Fistulifera solaris]